MSSSKFNFSDLERDPEIVAAIASADEAFGLMNRTLGLPPYWAALVTTEHGEKRVCAAGSKVEGEGLEEVMLVRTNPVSMHYQFDGLNSEDNYSCGAALTVRVRLSTERSELAAFRENIVGSRRTVRVSDLRSALQAAVRSGVREFVRSQPVVALVGELCASALLEALKTALVEVLFKSGLTLSGLHGAELESASYLQDRREHVRLRRQRERQDIRAQLQGAIEQAQNERLAHLEGLLGRLKTLANDSPQTHLQELIKTFDESQRGELYEALWAGDDADGVTQWLVVVCGDELVFFDPATAGQPARRVSLETPLGPLRSIAYCHSAGNTPVLLVGAATGVAIVHAESSEILGTYAADVAADQRVRGGFNSVALAGEYVFGAHSELGLWRWLADEPEIAAPLLSEATAGAGTVRHVQFVDGRVFVAIDSRIHSTSVGDDRQVLAYEGSRDTVTGLLCCEGSIFAGTAVGEVLRWSAGDPANVEALYRGSGRAVETIGRLMTGGVERLLFTDTSAAVHALVLGDAFRCHYRAGGQTIRRAEYAPDWIVGTNETRDRLFCWRTGRPTASPTVVVVGQLTGHSIQDVCLVPQLSAAS